MVLIPFSVIPPPLLRKMAPFFEGFANMLLRGMPYLQLELDRANMHVEARKYLSQCITATLFLFLFTIGFLALILSKLGGLILAPIVAVVLSAIVFFFQMQYPNTSAFKRVRDLDKDLLAALRAVVIQLNAGVPVFEALVIISQQSFGEVSKEFRNAVNEINAGESQITALERMALKNPSPYFRRSIWQMITGMKEGANIQDVVDSIISNLTKEQIIQIEKYGSQLSPMAMFYMMGVVVVPALGITFLIVITAFIQLDSAMVKLLFYGLLGAVVFFQLIATGIIKTKRPTLLGD